MRKLICNKIGLFKVTTKIDTLENVYTAMQVSGKFGNFLDNLDVFDGIASFQID